MNARKVLCNVAKVVLAIAFCISFCIMLSEGMNGQITGANLAGLVSCVLCSRGLGRLGCFKR